MPPFPHCTVPQHLYCLAKCVRTKSWKRIVFAKLHKISIRIQCTGNQRANLDKNCLTQPHHWHLISQAFSIREQLGVLTAVFFCILQRLQIVMIIIINCTLMRNIYMSGKIFVWDCQMLQFYEISFVGLFWPLAPVVVQWPQNPPFYNPRSPRGHHWELSKFPRQS